MKSALAEKTVITSRIDMLNKVIEDYRKEDTELCSLFFDFPVKMTKAEILETYAELQEIINGDIVVRIEGGQEQEELIPAGKFNERYEGNCKEFLESFNGSNQFLRMTDDEILDFIF